MMSRSGKSNYSVLLLEGYDDLRFYKNYTHAECIPLAMGGREEVLGTLKELAFRKQKGIVGIIDADCDYLTGMSHPSNVFRTDFRDLEGMLINSPALTKVLNENLVPQDIGIEDLKHKLVNACRDLGYLRCAILKKGWSLDFKTLNFKAFVQPNNLSTDRLKLLTEVLQRNAGFQCTVSELSNLIKEVELATHHGFHVCMGHDLAAVLAIWTGHKKGQEVFRNRIQEQLRLAVESEYFLRSELVARLRQYETQNMPYKLLR